MGILRKSQHSFWQISTADPARSNFRSHELEAARLALQAACKQLEKDERKSSVFQMTSLKRTKHRAAANEALLGSGAYDFNSLQTVVEGFESQWKDGQKHVSDKAGIKVLY